ncbi:TorF family putative porin [Achromobacter xylosoxidans]|uniref:TorF family putative porin n=1 Tax=Alcaligenes xylosoxydans xylosoxydans TaxID=85698 RepID=UPI001F141A13|nr:TorF family putative porin [Achromobacter xylosoxidans]MCZ8386551.1 TorF family putative porin [Achromobacter xylosoxidans]WPQ34272.1 TorF family putative porin [Achromobacter xylosoxidans]
MSRNTLAALALVALAAPAHAADSADADAPEYTLTANVTLASQYRYRGLMQTNNKPAIQGGFDFTHASGLYLGNWNSSVSWLNDGNSDVSAPVEMDFYGGYKGNLAPDVPFDLGVLQYYYPGDYPSGYTSPDTTELYAGVGYGPVMFKYSVAMTNLFGFADSKYSQYFDLSGNFDTGFWGLTVNAHVGRQTVRNLTDGAYTDWKLGLTKDFGQGLAISVAYIDTNADRAVYTNSRGRYMGRATGLLSLTKTF